MPKQSFGTRNVCYTQELPGQLGPRGINPPAPAEAPHDLQQVPSNPYTAAAHNLGDPVVQVQRFIAIAQIPHRGDKRQQAQGVQGQPARIGPGGMGGKRVGADGKEDGINNIPRDAPTRVRVPQRVVVHVRIPVEALRLPRLRHNRIRLDEAGDGGIIPPGAVMVQFQGMFPPLAGEAVGNRILFV